MNMCFTLSFYVRWHAPANFLTLKLKMQKKWILQQKENAVVVWLFMYMCIWRGLVGSFASNKWPECFVRISVRKINREHNTYFIRYFSTCETFFFILLMKRQMLCHWVHHMETHNDSKRANNNFRNRSIHIIDIGQTTECRSNLFFTLSIIVQFNWIVVLYIVVHKCEKWEFP